jgi:type II secretory pathway predicted ATPase ExeA
MYDVYWGLNRPLFTPAAVRQSLAGSPVHAEALARLDFLRESRAPLGLLLGPAGSGKSTVLTEFAERAARSGALVALANAAGADELAVLMSLAIGLQVAADSDAATIARRLVDRLEEIQLEGVPAIVLLDDLDRASPRVLLLVERLIASGGTALTIVAACRNQTVTKIGSRLLDVAALRIDLTPWDETETKTYLSGSLASAGRQQPAFDDAATQRLFELSGGAPRRVNQLAHLALVAGASQKLIQVDEATVEAVQEELSLSR